MADRALPLDKRQVRRAFGRAADDYDAFAVLQREIASRMMQRLDTMRIQPAVVLDIGCGTGEATGLLLRRYPKARVWAMDIAMPMLAHARRRGRWLRRPGCVCADLDALPFADASVDLVFANASLQWSADPMRAFADIGRILRPGGLLLFSSFGPDTLHELRAAWADVDGYEHVHRFVDMHDYGDMMMHAGLADPILDVERMTLTYGDAKQLMREVKGIGAGNATSGRYAGLTGRERFRQVCQAYERFRGGDGRLPVSYEVVHGHAWGGTQRRVDGETRVPLEVLRPRR